ncbi:MAG: DNRLRE domain-containing protein [Chloroflexi bacterium]|nr:DNRLRE domain-containing protein [Chloroflexota bacterium]
MTENKRRISRSLVLISILVLLIIASSLPAVQAMWADSIQTITLNATQDTYTDINFATTNMDKGLLNAANSPGPPEEPDVTTKKIFLEFDLSGVDSEIKSATLRLSTLTCGGLVPVDAVDVVVYGVANDVAWAEDTLTWENQPEPSTGVLVSLDAGATVFDTAQTYAWPDNNQGDFVAWLNTQRSANDGSATLVLVIANADKPGIADVFFNDREGSGTVNMCADALGSPTLTLNEVDLSIAKERAGVGNVTPGDRITYTLTIANASSTAPVTATVVDAWTPITAVVGVDAPGCDTTNWAAGVVTCTRTNLGQGTAYLPDPYLTLTTNSTFSGTLTNTASITPTGGIVDANPSNNVTAPVIVTVTRGLDTVYLPLVLRQ